VETFFKTSLAFPRSVDFDTQTGDYYIGCTTDKRAMARSLEQIVKFCEASQFPKEAEKHVDSYVKVRYTNFKVVNTVDILSMNKIAEIVQWTPERH